MITACLINMLSATVCRVDVEVNSKCRQLVFLSHCLHLFRPVAHSWRCLQVRLTVVLRCLTYHYSGRKEGNVLFNDEHNTFYLRLYGVRHMVKDHSDSEKGNLLPPHRLLFLINSKGSFICTIPQTG